MCTHVAGGRECVCGRSDTTLTAWQHKNAFIFTARGGGDNTPPPTPPVLGLASVGNDAVKHASHYVS